MSNGSGSGREAQKHVSINPNGAQQENLFRVGNLAGVEAVLGDLSSLNLVALLQLALTKTLKELSHEIG